jgi:hypothetical protein
MLRLTLPVLLGVLCATACAPSWRDQVLQNGVPARAIITSIDQTGVYINDQPQCEIGLRVEPQKGAPFDASTRQIVLLTQIPQVQPGRVVTVRYDPRDPTRVAIEALGWVALDEAGAKRLLEEAEALRAALNQPGAGTAATAIVIAFEPTGVQVNGENPLAELRVKVLPPGGAPFDAKLVGVFARERLSRYQPGQEIRVRYDAADPRRVTFDAGP